MKPYYEQDGVAIYHGDCRDILWTFSDIDLLVADPPYGIDYQPARDGRVSGPAQWERGTKVTGDAEPFDPAPLLEFPKLVLFGANHYANRLPASAGWIVWDKTPRGPREGFVYSHAELAWTNCIGRVQKFALEWDGSTRNGEDFLHPTQKPVALLRWIIGQFASGDGAILDPYCGSGTTLIAARELGRRAFGIEIEEKYCEVAAKRLRQGMLFTKVA